MADRPIRALKEKGAEIIISLNASPFEQNKQEQRKVLLKVVPLSTISRLCMPIAWAVKMTWCLMAARWSSTLKVKSCKKHQDFCSIPCMWLLVTMPKAVKWYYQNSANHRLRSAKSAETYQALVVGLRDYVNHSGFKGVLVGLSGGIDSALTLCIAVDALGADKVYAVMMPMSTPRKSAYKMRKRRRTDSTCLIPCARFMPLLKACAIR